MMNSKMSKPSTTFDVCINNLVSAIVVVPKLNEGRDSKSLKSFMPTFENHTQLISL